MIYFSSYDSAQSSASKLAFLGIFVKPSKAREAMDIVTFFVNGRVTGRYWNMKDSDVFEHVENIKVELSNKGFLKESFSSAVDQAKIQTAFKMFIINAMINSDFFGFNTVRKTIEVLKNTDELSDFFTNQENSLVPAFSSKYQNFMIIVYMHWINYYFKEDRKYDILSSLMQTVRDVHRTTNFGVDEDVFNHKIDLFKNWVMSIENYFTFWKENFAEEWRG